MKYLLVLLVVGLGLWLLVKRVRGPQASEGRPTRPAAARAPATPTVMVECAHCGLHLPSADALPEGSRLYCCESHRRLGPAPQPPA